MRLAMVEKGGKTGPAVALPGGGFLDVRSAGLPWDDLEGVMEAGAEGLVKIRGLAGVSPAAGAGGANTDAGRGGGAKTGKETGDGGANTGTSTGGKPSEPRLLCPLTRPEKILCIGKNYADHCREFDSSLPERPILFSKYRNALSGPGGKVAIPALSSAIDYEAELAAVIGKRCRGVRENEALDYVFGYTCANDLTMRDIQKEDGQWTRAKSPDGFCPLGPWIVTADEVRDPQALPLKLTLNGRVMQESSTREMVFSVAGLVSFLSQTMTLLPGDVILTGTPAGVGMGKKPPVYLRGGDRVVVEIEGIGALETLMV
jgi:2-keto-4-pentenoate hydratase/2-oxohepta-3-ene-1,7-dioic acid hydratase in catechol pathway